MKHRIVLIVSLALLGTACKAASRSAPPGMYDEYGEAEAPAAMGGDGGWDGEYARSESDYDMADLPQREMAAPMPPSAPEHEPTGGVTGGTSDPVPAVADDRPTDLARQIIYTATMSVGVFNVAEAHDVAESLPEKYGGWVANMSQGALVMKIPSKNLKAAMEEIGKMGVVEDRTLRSDDVSDAFYDLKTRIAVLEKTQMQMMDLLAKARNVAEALEVRKALDEITMELEVLKGQMRKLANQIAFSTLTLQLNERGPHDPVPSSNDPFPWVDELGVEATEWR